MTYKVATIQGDGVGEEVVKEGIKVVDKASELDGFKVEWKFFPNGAEHYLETKELMPEKTLKEIKSSCNAIYFGTFGDPRVKPGVLENGIILKTKHYFDQFVNLRPIKLLEGVSCPLVGKGPKDIDFTVGEKYLKGWIVASIRKAVPEQEKVWINY